MSPKKDKTEKHKGNNTSAGTPLKSGNSSRRETPKDPVRGATVLLQGVGKPKSSTGRGSTGGTPQTQTGNSSRKHPVRGAAVLLQGVGKPKSTGRGSTEGTPQTQTGNSSRRKNLKDPVRGAAVLLQGMSLDGKQRSSTGRGPTSCQGGGGTPQTRTATQAERSLAEAPKFIKVKVSGRFESQFRSAMVEPYMVSSSQVPPSMQGDEEVFRSMKVEMFEDGFQLVAWTAIGDNRHAPVLGILDTGASVINVNRQYMLSQGLKEDDLNNSLVGNDKYLRLEFQNPLNAVSAAAPLHQDRFTCGGQSWLLTVDKQSFYVLEQAPFPILIGVGPPTGDGLVGHGLKDAPTLLQTISKQHGLKEILGIDISPWRDAGNDWDVLKGSSIDFGGTDESRYNKSTLRYVSCPVHSRYYTHETKRVTYVDPSGKTVDLTRTKEEVRLDSGASNIMLPESIWKKYRSCLGDNGIEVFDHDNPRLKTIEKKNLAKLQPLLFHLVDVDGEEFSIDIPLAGQVYPPSMGPAAGCHDDKLIPLTVVPNHTNVILLGIPKFQRRYVILDLTTDPYRIGYAKKEKSDYVNPSLQEILNKYPRLAPIAPKPEQPRESQGGGSHRHRRN